MIQNTIPILMVQDLATSIGYYETVLGFALDWSTGDFASMSRDQGRVYLSEGAQGQPGTWLWVGVEDVDHMYAACRSKGANIVREMTNNPWAREFHVADPDGHVLRFGGEPGNDSEQ